MILFGVNSALMLAAVFLQRFYIADGETEAASEISTRQCAMYDNKCAHNCPVVENCSMPVSGSKKMLCYASWINDTNGYVPIMKGCWMNDDTCFGRQECVEHGAPKRSVHFCCCEGDMCNSNINFDSVDTPVTTTTSMPAVVRKTGDGQLLRTVMYSIVPIIAVTFIVVVVYWMWRYTNRNVYGYHQPLPTVDPAIFSTPSETSLYPLELLELRARGRFGSVWKAQRLDQHVAVKIFPLQDKHSWMTEKDTYKLPHMKHENVLNFICVEKRGENLNIQLWLITEFHEKGSLCDYLKGHSVTWSELCKIAESMARGLAFLHDEIPASRGCEAKPAVAHRDFKSKNVLIKSDLTACIADFGLTLKFEPGKSPGETHGLVGTRRYMAPEILEGSISFNRDAFLRIDMYACGLVLWELVSRCSALPYGEYQLPYEEEIGLHPTLEDMQELVVNRKVRPALKEVWETHSGLSQLVATVEECWDQDAEARLSAGCVQERIAMLARTVNVSTSATNPTTNMVMVIAEGEMPPKDSSI